MFFNCCQRIVVDARRRLAVQTVQWLWVGIFRGILPAVEHGLIRLRIIPAASCEK